MCLFCTRIGVETDDQLVKSSQSTSCTIKAWRTRPPVSRREYRCCIPRLFQSYHPHHLRYDYFSRLPSLFQRTAMGSAVRRRGSAMWVLSMIPPSCADLQVKSDSNLIFGRLKSLNSVHRILLTGTPLNNNLRELFNLLNFLDGDTFRSVVFSCRNIS